MLSSVALATAAVRRDGAHYLEWTGEGEFAGMHAVAWIPDPGHVTRGFILRPCHGRPPGSDNREWARAELDTIDGIPGEGAMTKRLARRYGFGVIGFAHVSGEDHWQESGDGGRNTHGRSTRALLQMLEEFATMGFPEFEHAPLLAFGGSHAGVASWSLACALPERMVAVAPNDPMKCLPAILPRDAFEVPIYLSQGELANGQDDKEERTLLEARRQGARVAYSNLEAMGHEDGPTFDLVFPFLEASIRRRLPPEADPQRGPVKLRSIPLSEGWLVGAEFRSGLVPLVPYASHPDDPRTAYWLPEKSLAHTYRGIASYGSHHVLRATPVGFPRRRLGMTRPHVLMEAERPVANEAKAFDALVRPGTVVELTVESRRGDQEPVAGWSRIEFFRDGDSLGAITSGSPSLRVRLSEGPRLFQTFTALVTGTDGTVRATRFGATLAVEREEPEPLLPPLPRSPLAIDRPLHFATGAKIGEVGVSSAILWTRLSATPEMLAEGAAFTDAGAHASADAQLAGRPLSDFAGAVSGAPGEVRVVYWPEGDTSFLRRQPWTTVDAARDFTVQFTLGGLRAASRYRYRIEARAGPGRPIAATFAGSFATAPRPARPARARFTVVTGQDYPRRDDPANGHRIYPAMLDLKPDFFIHTGDNEYFDKPGPWATRLDLARFKWNRIAALTFQREFHRQVPTFFMKDDHDTTRDDAWPGQGYGELTWEQGVALFREQVPMGPSTYRRVRWGRDLELWLLEVRDLRSANPGPDGPGKTILGAEQKRWLMDTLAASNATFRIVVSPTPIVGPDRGNKNDNHANLGFRHEGEELRRFLATQKGTVVICGDRHWQYVSRDPVTGLLEFCCGPTSEAHAGGFRLEDRTPAHRYLAVNGGFLSVEVARVGDAPIARFRHHGVDGSVLHEEMISGTL